MIEEDLNRIEQELQIQLPSAYRHRMTRFPIGVLVGNRHTELWDDAEGLISLNQQLRQLSSPWPQHFFSLGRDHGGSNMALDLRADPPTVFWCDRGWLKDDDIKNARLFDDWLIEWVRDMTADLIDEGLDPTASPELLTAGGKSTTKEKLAALGSCLFMLVAFCGGLFVVAQVLKWMKKLIFGA